MNDPGNLALGGYAFITGNPDELRAALKRAVEMIREVNFSFSQASVASSRIQDENYLYEGSFQPITSDPFWLGHLRKFAINNDGTVGAVIWDAGSVLQTREANSRNIKTLIGGSLVNFTNAISTSYFGITETSHRDRSSGSSVEKRLITRTTGSWAMSSGPTPSALGPLRIITSIMSTAAARPATHSALSGTTICGPPPRATG